MNDLDILRPEVAEAIRLFGAVIEELGLHDNYESALHVLCAELLRLAAIEADALIAMNDYDKLIATLRKTIKTWRKRARKADVQDDDAFATGFKICANRLEAILREHTMPKPAEE